MADKSAATYHPRTVPPWICQHCGKSSATDGINELHEPKCDLRPEGKK